jgi:hypothetical protein
LQGSLYKLQILKKEMLMSTYHSPSRLKKWSLFIFLFLFIGGLATASSGFAACEYLSSGDFSSGSGWTVNDATYWSIYNGMLVAGDDTHEMVNDTSTYAQIDFMPSDFFSVDVDVAIVSATDQFDRVGVRIRTSGDVFFVVNGDSGEYTTNGVLCYYYPNYGMLQFKVYDFDSGKWVVPLSHLDFSGSVSSIGLSMVADGVIFRVNGQDTNYKLTGDFSFGPYVVDQLQLYAGSGADGGGTLHARFDNVCASAYEVTDFPPGNAMPMPSGQEVLTPAAAVSPVTSIFPASANPFGFGPVASGGNILSLTAGISGLSAPADLYVGIGIGAEIYLFDAANGIHPLSTLVKWRANTTGGINDRILPDIDMFGIPGTFDFYFIMAPAGRLDVFRLWVTQLVIGGGGGSSVVTDKAMEAEVRQNLDFIFGLTSGFTGGLTELMTVFSDKNVVTTSPATLSLTDLQSGTPITISANFGSGYTMKSGSVMSGSAQLVISNLVFGSQGMGADFSGTFNNVMKDGVLFANGQLSGNVLLTENADETGDVSGQINFNNLTISGLQLSGTIQISGTLLDELELDLDAGLDISALLEMRANMRLTFSNFISGAYTITSGYVDMVSAGNGSATVTTNLQTVAGPVILNVLLTATPTSAVINTTSPGAAGPYTLVMNNVTLDDSCANYPAGGTVSFTSSSTGKTGVVTFTGACDGSYRYSEQ